MHLEGSQTTWTGSFAQQENEARVSAASPKAHSHCASSRWRADGHGYQQKMKRNFQCQNTRDEQERVLKMAEGASRRRGFYKHAVDFAGARMPHILVRGEKSTLH